MVAAIKRINKIELALATPSARPSTSPHPTVRKLLNRRAAWTQMLNSMRKLEKDTPGILEEHKKQIDIGEVGQVFTAIRGIVKANLSVDRANEVFDEMRRVADWLQQKSDGA